MTSELAFEVFEAFEFGGDDAAADGIDDEGAGKGGGRSAVHVECADPAGVFDGEGVGVVDPVVDDPAGGLSVELSALLDEEWFVFGGHGVAPWLVGFSEKSTGSMESRPARTAAEV